MPSAGLYLHIPFCRKACHYCNFHFSTSLGYKKRMLDAMIRELELRWPSWNHLRIDTVYLGGGTPSLLDPEEWEHLAKQIQAIIGAEARLECTLEANPEDINPDRVKRWKALGVNRLSIGIQSLSDADLLQMNRAHNANQARESIATARAYGIENISVDLIYGTPWKDNDSWAAELQWVIDEQIPHLSAYALTVEDKTALQHRIRKGQSPAPSDSRSQAQFTMLSQWADVQGWDHYEISNLCKPGFRAVHNSQYWNGTPYLGIGPSAHSYDGLQRSWNLANNALYMTQAEQATVWESEFESLSLENRVNETIMTQLRLREGLSMDNIDQLWPGWSNSQQSFLQRQQELGHLQIQENRIILSSTGRFLSDFITSELMVSTM